MSDELYPRPISGRDNTLLLNQLVRPTHAGDARRLHWF